MNPLTVVESVHLPDAAWLARIVAESFHDLPQDRWLVPDPADRPKVMAGFFQIVIRQAMATGTVQVCADGLAVAVWQPFTAWAPPPTTDDGDDVAEVAGVYVDRFRALQTSLAEARPHIRSHHHLALLAVRPGHQGQGYGSALLARHHRTLDQLQLPAYLEAATSVSREFYRRRGYRALAPPIVIDNDGPPPMWPMWREPQPLPST